VLVHGGAGGVGALTVQLAAILGANVTTTVRSDAGRLLRGFGAQRVIDVRSEAFDEDGAAYDVVIDTVGGETLDRSFNVLRRGGRLVTIAGTPNEGRAVECDVSATFFLVTSNRGQLTELARLVDGGRLRVEIAETFPLDKGREAFESGQRRDRRAGKTVLIVRDR
jgi:NADPH:quinone reductase-like Zn-dependent oxidoreductase